MCAAVAATVMACGGDDADRAVDANKPEALSQRARNKNLTREGVSETTRDLNRDGKPDQWYLSGQGGKLLRIERDLNFDDRVDVWEYPGATEGSVSEAEMDLDHDGRVDVVVYYREDGSLERKEMALEFGDRFTLFQFFDNAGKLLRVEHDEDGDGVVDRWDYYEGERVARTGWDEDKDGQPDQFDDMIL